MNIALTLDEAYARASSGLRQKMAYSVSLLRKAERLALAYDSRGGITLPSAEERTPRRCSTSPSSRASGSEGT